VDLAGMRLRAQGIAGPRAASPADVVTRLGAVQAQDYLGALWAVGLRTVDSTEADVEQALASGSIVRTWPMRGTLHFVAAADARWILELLAPRMLARAAGRLRALGLDEATFARARKALSRPLEGAGRLTRPEAYATLERAGISTAEQRGLHILFQLAHDRFLCFGPRQGKQHTLVLFDAWLPRSKRLPREEALAELAARYVTGHGPATTTDFAWWSGLSLADARRALDLARPRIQEHVAGGTRYWLAASGPTRPATTPARARDAYLLPAFDELLVAFKDRSATLDPAHALRANAGGGIFYPVVVVNGRVVATWKRSIARGEVVVTPAGFEALTAAQEKALARPLARYAAFLGVKGRLARPVRAARRPRASGRDDGHFEPPERPRRGEPKGYSDPP
jgi:hypothetical protein